MSKTLEPCVTNCGECQYTRQACARLRRFPIQSSSYRDPLTHGMIDTGPGTIPWTVAEIAYQEYLRQYPGPGVQPLKRLAERGGFCQEEMDVLYPGWRLEDGL